MEIATEQSARDTIQRLLGNRGYAQWALGFCLEYFRLEPLEALEWVQGIQGQMRLQAMWDAIGSAIYDSPYYALRQEWYHTGMGDGLGRPLLEFFRALPAGGIVLDWGCGTAEMGRRDWIDRGGRTILMDCAGPNFEYVKAKYPFDSVTCLDVKEPVPKGYDALICTHVFEHIERPIKILEMLWSALRPGGQALLWFDHGYPAPGHLKESIAQIPEYRKFLKQYAVPVRFTQFYNWVQKPMRSP